MSIETFIRQDILAPRLARRGVLVVYDPQHRYRAVCQGMEDEQCRVVDASESSILSREAASQALVALGKGALNGLVIYVPAAAPVADEERQRDPFAAFAACGETFPNGDSDSFESLCLKAKPDHGMAIRKIFEAESNPSFAVIDAVGGGLGWPNLRALVSLAWNSRSKL